MAETGASHSKILVAIAAFFIFASGGEGRRHNLDADLVRFLGNFDDRDIRATADYLSRLQGVGAVHKIMRDDGVVVD